MRIGFVVHGYPPDEAAGVELVAREQAEALARRGHEVSVFARAYGEVGEGAREERLDGVLVRRVGCPPGAIARFEDTYDNRAFTPAFEEFLNAARPDVVHAQHLVMLSPNLLAVARARGVPAVVSLHDAFYLCHRLFLLDGDGVRCPGPEMGARCVACLADLGAGEAPRQRFDFMARALAAADAVVAPSRALAERYAAELPFLGGRIDIVDPGLVRTPARPADRARGRGVAGDPLRFLFVGTWLPHKGLDLLVEAVARLDPARWRLAIRGGGVVGHEAYVEKLERATRGLPVEWLGAYPPGALDEVLAASDVLVLPSRCDESYSRVVREARSAGLAVVAPATGGPAEVLRDGVDALLVEPGSGEALAGALRALLDDPPLVRRLVAPPAAFPGVDDAARGLEAIYARVVARRAALARGGAHGAGGTQAARPPRVSVAYVTRNGAEHLEESLTAVRSQRGPFELVEILAVDSGSTDGTLELLTRHGARVLRIAAHEFGHGATRNLAARQACGDVVVYLTQDASPANDEWLARLIAPLAEDPLLAGTWSRHVPRPGCHPMECRKVEEFPLFHGPRLRVAAARGNPEWARSPELIAWFSNNASAVRRGVLERWPFPEVGFGEDRAWARLVLEAGFRTALVNDSLVRHSHAYSPWTNLRRHFDHARATALQLGGEDDFPLAAGLRAALRETRRDIAFWAAREARSRTAVAARWAVPAAAYHVCAFTGRWIGARSARLPAVLTRRLSLHERRPAAG